MPVPGAHVFAVQGLLSLSWAHTTGLPAMQLPLWQVWPSQTLPSGQATPFDSGEKLQAPVSGLQRSEVQTLPSLQLEAVPGWQTPAKHRSVPLHRSLSRQAEPSAAFSLTQPRSGSQLSLVQGFESSQPIAGPVRQIPPAQASSPLQTSPSEHGAPVVTGWNRQVPVA